jgi:hypothetical protein
MCTLGTRHQAAAERGVTVLTLEPETKTVPREDSRYLEFTEPIFNELLVV